jgi:hypothetical protein
MRDHFVLLILQHEFYCTSRWVKAVVETKMVPQDEILQWCLGYNRRRICKDNCLTQNEDTHAEIPKYKDTAFTVCRSDTDIVLLPSKFVDELRNLSEKKLSAIEAHTKARLFVDPSKHEVTGIRTSVGHTRRSTWL